MGVVNKKTNKETKVLSWLIVLITIISTYAIISSAYGFPSGLPVTSTSSSIHEGNITFSGNVTKDFHGHLVYINKNASAWGSSNNLSQLYLAYNSTYLFIGIQEIISDNGLLVAVSNETGSGLGTTNMTNMNVWARNIIFKNPINVFSAVWYGGSDSTQISGNASYRITSEISSSNNTPNAVQISSLWDINGANNTTEIAIPLSSIFANSTGNESIGISVLVIGGSSSWVGTAMPYNQTGPYSKGNTYFDVSSNLILNNVIYNKVESQKNEYYGSIVFTGNVTKDFANHLLYYNKNSSKWGNSNNISALYFSYNATNLFFGFSENIMGNSLLLVLSNNSGSDFGTYNFTNLNVWNRNITFSDPVNYFAAVYFSNSGTPNGNNSYIITSKLENSNSAPEAQFIKSSWFFNASNESTELSIPLSEILSPGMTSLNLSIASLVIGGSSSWVGTGIPYDQIGPYSTGNTFFVVNNTINVRLTGLKTSVPPPIYNPINLAIVFNDHQPLYTVVNSSNYVLPWTGAHATAEYIEQALIAHEYNVNITYELSGSLLYQLQNISTDPNYNNTIIQYSYSPYSQIIKNTSLYDAIVNYYFSIPSYVFSLNENASMLYNHIRNIWLSGQTLNETYFEDAKVLWFLYDISTPLVEGQLGKQWMNSTIWSLHNQTSFNQADLNTILKYSKWLTGQVIPAFLNDSIYNSKGSKNVELFTSPMFHPLVPLLLTTNISGPSGTIYKQSYYSDLMAQLNISLGQFHSLFGFWPNGIYSPENAFSYGMVQPYYEENGTWTVTAEWTLQQSGVDALAYGNAGSNVTTMENLYTPYIVLGQNNTSIYVFFRDGYLSNEWAFNYGSMGTSAAVSSFINYLKGIYAEIPAKDHNKTIVTVMLDGENWMFMSPFAMDGVPFLEQLYSALEANSSYIRTVTPSQYIEFMKSHNISVPVITHIATGSWNRGTGFAAPYQNNPSLEQWSGYQVQDFYWEALNYVRNQVLSFGQKNNLQQLMNYSSYEKYKNAPGEIGNYVRAWFGIYAAEGSDWFFTMAPWDIGGSNTAPFNYIFTHDLIYSLNQLNLSVPQFLLNNSYRVISPSILGDVNSSHTPELDGYSQASESTNYGNAFSITNNNTWSGATIYKSTSLYIRNVSIEYDPSNLYIEVQTSFNPSYLLVNRNISLDIYISSAIPNLPSSVRNNNPFAIYTTVQGDYALGFPASYVVEFNPYTFQSGSLSGQYSLYAATGLGTIQFQPQDINTPVVIGNTVQFAIPLNYLQLYPGQSFNLGVDISNGTNGNSLLSPLLVSLPTSLAKYYPVSSIHNTVPPNGPGNYTYPDQPKQIPPGSLDLEWVNVSMNSNFVQWNFTYGQLWNIWGGPNGFSNQVISVYVSQPGVNGATYLGNGPNANLSIPWQSMIYISGWSIYVQSYSGAQYTNGISSSVNYTTNTISVSIPLSYIGYNIESYEYTIISGSYDGYGINGWRIVDPSNTSNGGWQGGGGDPPWSSNIYSYIAPATVGQGNITQQEALQYAPHKIPTIYPISLPILKNSTVQTVKFNHTAYSSVNLVRAGNYYVEFYISNASGTNELYYATSSNGALWSNYREINGTNGISQFSALSSTNSTVLGVESVGGQSIIVSVNTNDGVINILKVLNGNFGNIGNIFNATKNEIFISFYFNSTSMNSSSANYQYKMVFYNLSSGSVSTYNVGQGSSNVNGFYFNGNEYLIYYSGYNMKGYEISGSKITNFNISGNYSGIFGRFSVSINSLGNLWISYLTYSNGDYSLRLSNISINGTFVTYKQYNVITTTEEIIASTILLSQSGSNNSVLLSWVQKGKTEFNIWSLKSNINFAETAIKSKQISVTQGLNYLYYISGAIVVVILIALLSVYFIRKRKK